MRRRLLSSLIVVAASSPVAAGCIEPALLVHSTVGITRYFDDDERIAARPDVEGIRGTGWFLSPQSMVTVKHVAAAMNLSDQSWKQLQIRNGESTQLIAARVQRFAGTHSEKIAVLELQTAVSRAKGFQLRIEPLVVEGRLLSLAYPGDRLRVAGGRFVQYGEGDRFAGTALLEMYDGDDRLVLDHGASGAPVLDCQPVYQQHRVHVTESAVHDRLGKSQRRFGARPSVERLPRGMTRAAARSWSPGDRRCNQQPGRPFVIYSFEV